MLDPSLFKLYIHIHICIGISMHQTWMYMCPPCMDLLYMCRFRNDTYCRQCIPIFITFTLFFFRISMVLVRDDVISSLDGCLLSNPLSDILMWGGGQHQLPPIHLHPLRNSVPNIQKVNHLSFTHATWLFVIVL